MAPSPLPVSSPLGRNLSVDPAELRPQGRCRSCSRRRGLGPHAALRTAWMLSSLEAARVAHGFGQGLCEQAGSGHPRIQKRWPRAYRQRHHESGWTHGGFCNCPGPSGPGRGPPVGEGAAGLLPHKEAIQAPALALGRGPGLLSRKRSSALHASGCVRHGPCVSAAHGASELYSVRTADRAPSLPTHLRLPRPTRPTACVCPLTRRWRDPVSDHAQGAATLPAASVLERGRHCVTMTGPGSVPSCSGRLPAGVGVGVQTALPSSADATDFSPRSRLGCARPQRGAARVGAGATENHGREEVRALRHPRKIRCRALQTGQQHKD